MRFKIYKHQVEMLADLFRKKDDICSTIELEPVMDTCAEMQMKMALEESAFKRGYDLGYKEAWAEYRCTASKYVYGYDPASPSGDYSSLVIAKKEDDGSIKIVKSF